VKFANIVTLICLKWVITEMAKTHISKSNGQRCKEYRNRQKAKLELLKKDNIELMLEQHLKEKKQEKIGDNEQKGIKISSLEANSREPKEGLISQYQNESEQQYNLFGELEGIENPLDKVSHQQNLKNIFGNRAE
jgi:hypothetical protein